MNENYQVNRKEYQEDKKIALNNLNNMSSQSTGRHSILKSVVLHLVPGLLALLAYILLARPIQAAGFPSIMAWLITALFITIPFELGYMLYQGQQLNGRLSLTKIILYRQPLKAGQIVLWTILTFMAVTILFIVAAPVTKLLQTTVFGWVPDWFMLDTGLEGEWSKSKLLIVNITSLFVSIIGIPIVEELYFRGYLLPRLSHLGIWAIFLSSFLFALYHFTTPWMVVSRFLFTLPLAYLAYQKKNLTLVIVIHALGNSIEVILGFVYVLGM